MTNPPNHEHDLTIDDLLLTTEPSSHTKRDCIGDDKQPPEILIAPERHHQKKTKKRHTLRNILLLVAVCLLGMTVTAVGTVVVLQDRGKASLLPDSDVTLTVPESIEQQPDVEVTDNGRTITYKGETYKFNENRTNILCIGIDKDTLGLEGDIVGTGGQADTLILLSIDTATGDIDALSVSRDTITDIDQFSTDGSFVGTERTQLCLAYAYGDGREQSCEATARAVSRLLYNIPINSYFAVDLDSIATLNDAVGGVQVTLLSDFRRSDGTICKQGETITLYGEDALWYVRMRDTEQLDSNNDRMAHQKQYLEAFAAKALSATKESLQVPLELYTAVADDSITDLNPSKITFLTTKLIQHSQLPAFTSVKGEVIKSEDDGYAEFHVDDTALYEQVLNVFYTKQS